LRGDAGEQLASPIAITFATVDGQWQSSAPIPANGATHLGASQIAFDGIGNAFAVWDQFDATRVRAVSGRYTAGLGWGVPERLETTMGDAFEPEIAADASGNALAVWTQFDGTNYNTLSSRYTAGSGWGQGELIETAPGSVQSPEVAFDSAGNAVALWVQLDGVDRIVSNRYIAGIGWNASPLTASDGSGASYEQKVVFDPSGNALAVWTQNEGTQQISSIRSSLCPPGGSWSAAVSLETGDGTAFEPQIAIDPNGNALSVWTQYAGGHARIWSNRYTGGGGWSAAALIETSDGDAAQPQIAIDASGNALAVWQLYDGKSFQIRWNRYTPGSGWGTAAPLEIGAAGAAFAPQIAIDRGGNALAVWRDFDGTNSQVRAARYRASSGWSTPARISSDSGVDFVEVQLAVDAYGNALATWTQRLGNNYTLWFNRFE
jgi:hypothetical protein